MGNRQDEGRSSIPPPPTRQSRLGLKKRLRKRDSMGALRPLQAEADSAFTRGYSAGIDEGHAELIDRLRTLMLAIYERRTGMAPEDVLDALEMATAEELILWIERAAFEDSLQFITKGRG